MKPQFTMPQPSPYTRMPAVRGSSDRAGSGAGATVSSSGTARTPYLLMTWAASSSRPQASR